MGGFREPFRNPPTSSKLNWRNEFLDLIFLNGRVGIHFTMFSRIRAHAHTRVHMHTRQKVGKTIPRLPSRRNTLTVLIDLSAHPSHTASHVGGLTLPFAARGGRGSACEAEQGEVIASHQWR